MFVATLRHEMEDESLLSASLVVTKNDLTGELDPWRDVYEGSDEVTVMDAPALRTFEESHLNAPELFDEPITVRTWRYVVPFDVRSTLLFSFTTPNSELQDSLLAHFETIMERVEIVAVAA